MKTITKEKEVVAVKKFELIDMRRNEGYTNHYFLRFYVIEDHIGLRENRIYFNRKELLLIVSNINSLFSTFSVLNNERFCRLNTVNTYDDNRYVSFDRMGKIFLFDKEEFKGWYINIVLKK